ncbi:hypothetical protein ACHAWF_015650 [Thalassiosira exigua]
MVPGANFKFTVPKSALVGKIQPILASLGISRDDARRVVRNVSEMLNGVDLAVLQEGTLERQQEDEGGDNGEIHEYAQSYTFLVADNAQQVARLSLLVYACDCFVVAFRTLGYRGEQWALVSFVFAKILFSAWAARRLRDLKRYLLARASAHAASGDAVLDYLSVETGISIFAVSTTGTLIVSLASQEIARGMANGVEMALSDRFFEGNNVHFGDGTQGYIVKMGFLRAKVRKYDGSVVDIPNCQLGGQRVTNVTRTKTCQVLTTLRFEYDDVQRLPKALEAVKDEIATSCPTLITEGKPFRARISSFEERGVVVIVNCNFKLPPTGDEFWRNREEMLLAIDRGVTKSGLRYAKPIFCHAESAK